MGIGTHVALDVGSRLAQAGSAIHLGIEIATANARVRREKAVDSVTELAFRLDEAREDEAVALQHAALCEARAVAAERDLRRALAQVAELRAALQSERELSTGLREILGV